MHFVIVTQFSEDWELGYALRQAGHTVEVRTDPARCWQLWAIPEAVIVIAQYSPGCLRPSLWDWETGDELARHLIAEGCRVVRCLYHNQLPVADQEPRLPVSAAPNEYLRKAWKEMEDRYNVVDDDALGLGYICQRSREYIDQEVVKLLALIAAAPTA